MSFKWSATSDTPRSVDPAQNREDPVSRCPRCGEPGEALGDVHSTLQWFLCRSCLHVWFGEIGADLTKRS